MLVEAQRNGLTLRARADRLDQRDRAHQAQFEGDLEERGRGDFGRKPNLGPDQDARVQVDVGRRRAQGRNLGLLLEFLAEGIPPPGNGRELKVENAVLLGVYSRSPLAEAPSGAMMYLLSNLMVMFFLAVWRLPISIETTLPLRASLR